MRGGRAGRSGRLLLRRRGRRSVEDRRRRLDLESDLRPRRLRVGRSPGDRAVGREGDLRRHRPDPGALRHRVGRRRVSVGRRRRDVDARRPRSHAGHRPDRRRSARCQRRRRRRARAHVRQQPRARDLPHGGRRENLGARALRGREDGRRRPRGGSGESLDSLRVALAGAQLPLALLLQAHGRVGQRGLQVPRRGPYLDEALGRRLAVGRRRANRSRGRAGRSRLRPRGRRGRRAARAFRGGPVSLRRWRGELEPRQRHGGSRLELHEPRDRGSEESRRSYT